MHPEIKRLFDPDILNEIRSRYQIDSEMKELGGFESFIYEFSKGDESFILRISHSSRRSKDQIAAELEWIRYLFENGMNVCRGVLSPAKHLVESVNDNSGGEFIASVFCKAPGTPPWEAEWDPAFSGHYGRVIGKMHSLSKKYIPAKPEWKRYEWDDPCNMDIFLKMPASEKKAMHYFRELISHFNTLPRDKDSYGLIHQDAHGGNFFVENGKIWLFDFDDAVYSWFIYDIAMVLFYNLLFNDDDKKAMRDKLVRFFTGYFRENNLDPGWLSEIPNFLKMREIDLYAAILHDIGPDIENDDWCRRYMEGRKENIESNRPFIDYDWMSIIDDIS